MTDPDAKKKKSGIWAIGALFSLALAGVCVLLFLLPDPGAGLLAALGATTTVYEPTPQPTAAAAGTAAPESSAQPQQTPLSAEAFLARGERFGAEAKTALSSENDRVVSYTLSSKAGDEATLTLSLQNGTATAFTLSMLRPDLPAPLAPDAGWILQQEHAKRQVAYEASVAWFCDAFCAYALALDCEETVPYAEIQLLAEPIRAMLSGGEAEAGKAGDFQMDVSTDPEGVCTATLRRVS